MSLVHGSMGIIYFAHEWYPTFAEAGLLKYPKMASAVAASPGFTAIGGGETVAAARRAGAVESIDHVSTGGGASLDLLAGKALPGIAVLERETP